MGFKSIRKPAGAVVARMERLGLLNFNKTWGVEGQLGWARSNNLFTAHYAKNQLYLVLKSHFYLVISIFIIYHYFYYTLGIDEELKIQKGCSHLQYKYSPNRCRCYHSLFYI